MPSCKQGVLDAPPKQKKNPPQNEEKSTKGNLPSWPDRARYRSTLGLIVKQTELGLKVICLVDPIDLDNLSYSYTLIHAMLDYQHLLYLCYFVILYK